MATLQAGYTFGATETVTNAKLASLVNSGTVSSIVQSDIDSNLGLVSVSASAPSDTDQLWVDTGSTPNVLRFYNSNLSAWVPAGELGILTNRSGQTGSSGRVLILDTSNSNSYKYASTAGDTSFIGIETGSISNTSSAPVITRGLGITTILEHSASAGTFIRTSTASGKAEPCVRTAQGIFGFVQEAGTASAKCVILGVQPNLASVDQTANYSWTGTHAWSSTMTLPTASGQMSNWSPLVQLVTSAVTTSANASTVMPKDDTIPQNTEGVEVLSASITPKHANNRLLIQATVVAANSGNGNQHTVALFQDSTANALCAVPGTNSNANYMDTIHLTYEMAAGTTSATTFKIRLGPDSGTTTFNGFSAGRAYGGVVGSIITIQEIKK